MKKALLYILPVFYLMGCVTAKTTGFVDPDYRESGYEISKVVIQVNGATMEETQIAEQALLISLMPIMLRLLNLRALCRQREIIRRKKSKPD